MADRQFDETAFQAVSATRLTSSVTGIVDLTRAHARHGCSRSWPTAAAALDPYRGDASALRTSLPGAVRVLDAFHLLRLRFAVVDGVRRRIQQRQLATAAVPVTL